MKKILFLVIILSLTSCITNFSPKNEETGKYPSSETIFVKGFDAYSAFPGDICWVCPVEDSHRYRVCREGDKDAIQAKRH